MWIRYIYVFLLVSTLNTETLKASHGDFDQHTLQELIHSSSNTFREFAQSIIKQQATQTYIENQIFYKHCSDMYSLWSKANTWEEAGKGDNLAIRDKLVNLIQNDSKNLIKSMLKREDFVSKAET